MKKTFPSIFSFLFAIGLSAQEQQTLINVHLDPNANLYEPTFLTNEIRFVNYVSDRRLCDVQVQSITEPVGNGAVRYRYFFFGYKAFEGQNDTVVWHSDPAENEGSIREKSLRAFKQGLLPYLLQTPIAQSLDYQIQGQTDNADTPDPWKRWTLNPRFDLSGNGSFFRDTNGFTGRIDNRQRFFRANPSFSAWRIGHKWRFGADIGYSYFHSEQKSNTGIGDNSSTTRSLNINLDGVYALGQHWSVGAGISGQKDWFGFFDVPFENTVSVGLEYSYFPYREYFRRRLLVGYTWEKNLTPDFFIPIFGTLEGHTVFASFAKVNRWGYLEVGTKAEASFDFENWARYSLRGNIRAGVNLGKNLFLTLQVTGSWGNSDLTLASLGGTPIVFSSQVRSGDYDYWVGVAYFFGSGYRNIINPRLGGQF